MFYILELGTLQYSAITGTYCTYIHTYTRSVLSKFQSYHIVGTYSTLLYYYFSLRLSLPIGTYFSLGPHLLSARNGFNGGVQGICDALSTEFFCYLCTYGTVLRGTSSYWQPLP